MIMITENELKHVHDSQTEIHAEHRRMHCSIPRFLHVTAVGSVTVAYSRSKTRRFASSHLI